MTDLFASSLINMGESFHFLVINQGGFRSTWYPGVIRYAEIHSMLPYEDTVAYF